MISNNSTGDGSSTSLGKQAHKTLFDLSPGSTRNKSSTTDDDWRRRHGMVRRALIRRGAGVLTGRQS